MENDRLISPTVFLLIAVIAIACAITWHLYKIGIQQEVYRRQGIYMTRWELLVGATPAVKISP